MHATQAVSAGTYTHTAVSASYQAYLALYFGFIVAPRNHRQRADARQHLPIRQVWQFGNLKISGADYNLPDCQIPLASILACAS